MSEQAAWAGARTMRSIGRALTAAVLAVALSACNFDDGWFATWTAAQHNYNVTFPNNIVPPPAPITVSNQSVREIIHISRGGHQARIKLSNEFGTAPVTFAEVRLARSTGGGSVDPSTDRPVRFDGKRTVTLLPGEARWSDAVALKAPTQADLAVSLYVADSAPVVTAHGIARQTNYMAASNQTGAAAMTNAVPVSAYFWLAAVDMSPAGAVGQGDEPARVDAGEAAALAADRPKVLVAFGDSITDGAATTLNANRRWPNLFDHRVQAAAATVGKVSVVNAGISGNRWLNDGVGPSGQSRFARDVLDVSGVTHAVILLGINDIGIGALYAPQNVSADQIIAAVRAAVARAKARQIKVYLGTLTPYAGAAYYNAEGEAKRQAINAFVRSAPGVDGVIDFDSALRDPANPAALLPAYDSGDHLHPNDLGNQAMADAVPLSMFQN